MSEKVERLTKFVAYATTLEGDEKGEAQVFCDRLFQAFGHKGYKEAGAALEYRVKNGKRTKFADLLWKPRLLIEMKSAGEKLEKHYQQAFEYWIQLVPHRPKYVVLCNFDEFWIYDFDSQLHEPVDRVAVSELPQRYTALNFLFPEDAKPQFGNDRVDVTRKAAAKVGRVFRSLVARGVARETAQRFSLQCVVATSPRTSTSYHSACSRGSFRSAWTGRLGRFAWRPVQADERADAEGRALQGRPLL